MNPRALEPHERVVVTGLGALTPVGNSVEETWEALKAGRSGIQRMTLFDASSLPCQISGEIRGFNPRLHLPNEKARHMAAASQFAVYTAHQAWTDSGLDLDHEDRDRVGVVIGTAGGATIEETEAATRSSLTLEGKRQSPFRVVRLWPNMSGFAVAHAFGFRGYNSTVCTACASGTQAIGEAAEVIRRGDAEIMVAAGTDSAASQPVMAGYCAIGAMATGYNDEPQRAMRPFDAKREGFVGSQGSASLILESLTHAQQRGAHIYAEILGFGVSNDAFHMAEPDPRGEGAALAMMRAIKSAGIAIEQIDYINAHATSTPLGDLAEVVAIKSVLGNRAYQVPISATKSMVGHPLGAAGAIEAVACVMSLREGVLHPTINYENPDPQCDLDFVPNQARTADVRVVLSNSFGMGGQNAVLVFGVWTGTD
jgi:3-oxoacyl-[acyl-carrier-protein] synthase II